MAKASCNQDVAALRDALRRTGYVFLEGAIDRGHVQRVRELVIGTLVDQGCATYEGGRILPVLPVRTVGSPEFCRCLDALLRHEALHLLAYEPSLMNILQAITGWQMFAHPRKTARAAYPAALDAKDRLPAHQDMYYVCGGCDTFTAWIPLGDYPVGHGGLGVLEGSHLRGLYPTETFERRFRCNAVLLDGEESNWRTADYRMGDVLLFHSLTVHESGVNESPEFRLSMDCRYSAADQVLNSDQLLPDWHANVSPWSELTAGWANPDLFRPPEGLVTESPTVGPHDVLHRDRFIGRSAVVKRDTVDR
jgi:hypothetical protein